MHFFVKHDHVNHDDTSSKQVSRHWDRAEARAVGKRNAHRQVVVTDALLRKGHQEVVVAPLERAR